MVDDAAPSPSPALKDSYVGNYFLIILYAASALLCFILVMIRRPVGKDRDIHWAFRWAYLVSMSFFSLGTLFDNSRLVAGARASTWPDGIWQTQDDAIANALVAAGTIEGFAYGPMINISHMSFFLHEVTGSIFTVSALYLWLASRKIGGQRRPPRFLEGCGNFLEKHMYAVSFVIVAACILLGFVGYLKYSVPEGFELVYNPSLGGWRLTTKGHNPLELVGVFTSSIVWIAVGAWLAWTSGCYWFFAVNLLCFLGQAAGEALGDYKFLLSNFLEQVALYALLGLSEWLIRYQERREHMELFETYEDSEYTPPSAISDRFSV